MRLINNYKLAISLTLLFALFSGCKNLSNPTVTIRTEVGEIKVELYQDKAPITVNNFLEYVEKNMFDNGEFYRVVHKNNQPNNKILIDVIQGGISWDENLPRLKSISHESTNKTKILHKKGVISMARNEPGTASSEFFICLKDEPELDYGGMRNSDGKGFAAFGKIIEGMSIVEQINQMPDSNQMLILPVKILSVKNN